MQNAGVSNYSEKTHHLKLTKFGIQNIMLCVGSYQAGIYHHELIACGNGYPGIVEVLPVSYMIAL